MIEVEIDSIRVSLMSDHRLMILREIGSERFLPIFERTFIHDSYANQTGYDSHRGLQRFTRFARSSRYVLQCDIRKYFPSIDHTILWEAVARVVGDRDVLRLVAQVLATRGDGGLLWPSGKGIPIGNQTSQFFANVYLDRFDHWMKETLRRRFYLRYVDDFLVLGESAREMAEVREAVGERLAALELQLHPVKQRIFPVTEGCDFVGYRIFPGHRLLRRHSGYRFRRRLRGMARAMERGELTPGSLRSRIASWVGHARHADTWGLRRAIFGEVSFHVGKDDMQGRTRCVNLPAIITAGREERRRGDGVLRGNRPGQEEEPHHGDDGGAKGPGGSEDREQPRGVSADLQEVQGTDRGRLRGIEQRVLGGRYA